MDAIFIGGAPAGELPLDRYLPPQPTGVFAGWLNARLPAGELVLDPLGTHPGTALEAARAGYRVITCCNNPILVFMLELMASAPSRDELMAALAELATSRRSDIRLEQQLLEIYQTECPNCNRMIQAEAYIWEKNAEYPSARLVNCPFCKTEGEYRVTAGDISRYTSLGSDNLHRARALQRVAGPGEDHYENVLAALDTYAKRPLYVLFTLLNRIETLTASQLSKQLVQGLLLPVLDLGTSIWTHPMQRVRPRQLTTPPIVREHNLWLAMERAVDVWEAGWAKIATRRWPALPNPGEITIVPGRLRTLFPLAAESQPKAIITTLPRPGQAFWTLSALWSGWLWGRDSVTPLRSALERLRYDWNWHTRALKPTFTSLAGQLKAGTPIFALAPEMEPGFLTSTMVAASTSNLEVHGIALQEETDLLQVEWRCRTKGTKTTLSGLQAKMRGTIQAHLEARGEPAPYLTLLAHGLAAADLSQTFTDEPDGAPYNIVGQVQSTFKKILEPPTFSPTPGSQSQNPELANWFMPRSVLGETPPRMDQMERALVAFLLKHEFAPREAIDDALFAALPGLMTPRPSEIALLLDSYAEEHARIKNSWQLQERERPAIRRQDVHSAAADLSAIGTRLGYRVSGESPLLWHEDPGIPAYCFHILASSIVSSALQRSPAGSAREQVVVLPGSRCNLLSYKLKENPLFAKAFEGWHTLKFRNLRDIAERADLTREVWYQLLDADPPCWEEATQISIFPEGGELPLFPAL